MASAPREDNRVPAFVTKDSVSGGAVSVTSLSLNTGLVNAPMVAIVDSSGSQISSFGGGTQYTDAASTVAHPTGTMPVFDNGGTISKVSASIGLPVNIIAGAAGIADKSTFTASSSSFTPVGGVFNDSITAPTSGQAASVRITSARAMHTNLAQVAGSTVLTGTAGLQLVGIEGNSGEQLQVVVGGGGAPTAALGVAGVYNVTPLALTDGQGAAIQLDVAGNQKTVGNVASAATDSGNPVKVGAKLNTTLPTFTDGQRGDLQIGTRGSLHVELYTTNSTTAVSSLADNADAVATSGTTNKLPAVTRNTVYNGTTWDRQYGDATNGTWVNVKAQAALPSGSNTIGNVDLALTTSGGWSVSSQTALTTTATVSSAAGKFGGYMLMNVNSAPAYVQVFDTTGAVTLGTTTPTFVIPIPANGTAANGLAANLEMVRGIAITNGIKIAATTTATGATTVSTGLTGFILYK